MVNLPAVEERLGTLRTRFSHADGAESVLRPGVEDLHVVTGFGPTNAPTAGTLSVMIGTVELQRRLNVPVTAVISELGAWNSRNVAWARLEQVRDQMLEFLRALGFDETQGRLRSHVDLDNLTRAGKIARFLGRRDFLEHREELLELYEDHGLLGSEVGLTVDALYTVADILEPADRGHHHVLMISGLEEAYFTELARLVVTRQKSSGSTSLNWSTKIGALYFRVIEGLAGYPKMSKSIPDSAIHLGMEADVLSVRITSESPADQRALMSAMELASGWDLETLNTARYAYQHRDKNQAAWGKAKEHYLTTFLTFAEQWRACAR
ncbi:hypothetical protein [Streptomyces sp. NBRC 109706]|uniref:hypothetical protein n=1 Tax=Streptomyces sp. NBRC 109706 TaxID=1550035 RepID=UPI00131DE0C8|nr:hypothetical protein [Streptomyces sp. NBRC 109706]